MLKRQIQNDILRTTKGVLPVSTNESPYKVSVIQIDKNIVRAWMTRQKNYRRINLSRANRMLQSVRDHGWRNDGSPFRFDRDGNWIDGQHRGYVIEKLGLTVWAVVVYGCEDLTIDSGTSRQFSDWLRNSGEKNFSKLSSALVYLWKYEERRTFVGGSSSKPTNTELRETLCRNPSIRESVTISLRVGDVVTCSQVAMLHYVVAREDKSVADNFVHKLATGEGLGIDDPILRLRDRMTKYKKAKEVLPSCESLALLIAAWNYWIRGKPCRMLAWKAVGPNAQEFPRIVMPSEVDSIKSQARPG